MADFSLFVLATAGIYTIFSLGLLVQFGIAGLPNFGNGAFMAVSGYAMAIGIVKLGLPMIIAAPLAMVAAGEIVRYLALNLEGLTGGAAGTVNLLGPGQAADYNFEWLRLQNWMQDGISHLFHVRAK